MTRLRHICLAACAVLTLGAGEPLPSVRWPSEVVVDLRGPEAKQETTSDQFPQPVEFRSALLRVTVKVPPEFVQRPFSAIQIWAKDARGRWQNTSWSDGLISPENHYYNASNGTLELSYSPTAFNLSRQGWSQIGFDPTDGLQEIGLKFATPRAAPDSYRLQGTVEIQDMRVEPHTPLSGEPAIVTPVMKRDLGIEPGPARPVPVAQLKSGMGRYVKYGDFHRWAEVQPIAAQIFQAQRQHGLHAFRLMGGFDTRSMNGGVRVGPKELEAVGAYLKEAEAADQSDHILTLIDGAIPNDALQQAMLHPAAAAKLIDAFRPLLRRFGGATIDGKPLILDLVNEIGNVTGVIERQRQQFVEAFVDAVAEEAPGATITLGVVDYSDLAYWLHLLKRDAGRPIHWIVTFHAYQPVQQIPAVWDLNIPDSVEVGITEADTRYGMDTQLKAAADKGYRWLLFWQDQEYHYDPAEHALALQHLLRPSPPASAPSSSTP